MSVDADLKPYFAEAASWDADTRAQNRRTVRLALSVDGAGWLTVLMLAGALMLLLPLERVEPFVVRVDHATGIVDVAPGYSRTMGMPAAITRYLRTHHITVCQRF